MTETLVQTPSIPCLRPKSLLPGQVYWRRVRLPSGDPGWTPVRFVCHTACPAFVIVANGSKLNDRVPRDELFDQVQDPGSLDLSVNMP